LSWWAVTWGKGKQKCHKKCESRRAGRGWAEALKRGSNTARDSTIIGVLEVRGSERK